MDLSIQNTSPASSSAMSGASAPMSPSQKMSNLFDSIDTIGSGTITNSQFEQAFQSMNPPGSVKAAGADAIWKKLDPDGAGKVSKQDFATEMAAAMKALRGAHHHHGSGKGGAQQVDQNTTSLAALGTTGSSSGNVGSILNALA